MSDDQIRVTHIYALTIPVTNKQRRALDWLLNEVDDLYTDETEHEFNRNKDTFEVRVTVQDDLDWMELLATSADYEATRSAIFTESANAAEARKQTMVEVAHMVRGAMGLVNLGR